MATTKGGRGGGRGPGGGRGVGGGRGRGSGPTVKPAGGKGIDGRGNLPGPSTRGGKGSAVGGGKLPASGGQGKLPTSGESSKGPAVPSRKLPVLGKGKGISVDGGGEPSRRQQNRDGGGTPPGPTKSTAGGTPPGATKSTGGQASSNSSNPSGPTTPLSQKTTTSQVTASVSRTNLIPTQYPATSNRSGSQRWAFAAPLPEQPEVEDTDDDDEEEEEEEEEEEQQQQQQEVEEEVQGQQLGPEYAAVDDQEDYQVLLDNMFALPGRQNLPLLSEVPLEIEGRHVYW